ncbi:DUF4230 domain-containing protein [Rugosimonospora africana]|uniref:DUF4230 domain-containing protein n=1 Tax=Rugosimonospora africana TaxID=556532 RepID=A0A8J3QWX9_9ACTN|nr:DUF4230 domain-containing protein [Rugosimonospora africana]GIH17617.1 hypothetical protein Raf01_57890 [Rugosimonospora africana]
MASNPSFEPGRAGLPEEPTVRQPAAGHDLHPTSELPEIDTGTGWPEGEPATEAHGAAGGSGEQVRTLARREVDGGGDGGDGGDDLPEARRRPGGCLVWLAGAVALVVVLALVLNVSGLLPHFHNPFASKKTDRSQPTLLLSIQDLARFDAASGNFQEVIDVQQDRRFIPDIIFNDRALFVCVGSVDAYVDFTNIGQGDITDSTDHKTVTVRLPAAALEKTNIDHDKSYVFATQKGLANRIGDFFGGDENKEQELYKLGEQRIQQAAKDSGLIQRAEDNTKEMLEQLLKSLGYTTITVTFTAS